MSLFTSVAGSWNVLLQKPWGTHAARQRLRCSWVSPSLADLSEPQRSIGWGWGGVGIGWGFLTEQVLGVLRLLQQLQGEVACDRHAA